MIDVGVVVDLGLHTKGTLLFHFKFKYSPMGTYFYQIHNDHVSNIICLLLAMQISMSFVRDIGFKEPMSNFLKCCNDVFSQVIQDLAG